MPESTLNFSTPQHTTARMPLVFKIESLRCYAEEKFFLSTSLV